MPPLPESVGPGMTSILAFVGICLVVIANGLHCLIDCCGFGE